MLRFLRWPAVAVLALSVSACATMNVSSHVERGLDIKQYHTWDWSTPDALPENDARLDNSFFKDHFQGAVEREFSARGFSQTLAEGDVPDLRVHYHASISSKLQVNTGDQTTGACYDENCTVRVFDNEVGTIVIDVVDGHTNRLIWRGWAQNPVHGVLDHQQKFQARIQEAVTRMFARFPKSV
ncbi:MAG: DUF4136 domain-containing protein [Vicinamibacterales bacterium]